MDKKRESVGSDSGYGSSSRDSYEIGSLTSAIEEIEKNSGEKEALNYAKSRVGKYDQKKKESEQLINELFYEMISFLDENPIDWETTFSKFREQCQKAHDDDARVARLGLPRSGFDWRKVDEIVLENRYIKKKQESPFAVSLRKIICTKAGFSSPDFVNKLIKQYAKHYQCSEQEVMIAKDRFGCNILHRVAIKIADKVKTGNLVADDWIIYRHLVAKLPFLETQINSAGQTACEIVEDEGVTIGEVVASINF